MMLLPISVLPETFDGIQNVDIDRLSALPESALRPVMPCLVRMSLCAPLDSSSRWTLERKKILKCLSGVEVVNSLVVLLSIDFHELEQDAKKELQLRSVGVTVVKAATRLSVSTGDLGLGISRA